MRFAVSISLVICACAVLEANGIATEEMSQEDSESDTVEQIDGITTGLTNSSEVEDLLQADSRQTDWADGVRRYVQGKLQALEKSLKKEIAVATASQNKQLANLKVTDASQNKQLASLKATDNSLRSTIASQGKSLTASINAVSSRMIRCSAGWSDVSTSYKKLYYGTFKNKPAFTAAVTAATTRPKDAEGFWLTYHVEKSFAKVKVIHGVGVQIGWIACGN